jgi:hypothetical protein
VLPSGSPGGDVGALQDREGALAVCRIIDSMSFGGLVTLPVNRMFAVDETTDLSSGDPASASAGTQILVAGKVHMKRGMVQEIYNYSGARHVAMRSDDRQTPVKLDDPLHAFGICSYAPVEVLSAQFPAQTVGWSCRTWPSTTAAHRDEGVEATHSRIQRL